MEYTNENIENYLKGKLSPSEAKSFENTSKANPTLNAELAYEKTLSFAIYSHRKMALKARLSALPVPPIGGLNPMLSLGSATIKTAAAVLAAIGIGTGLYLYTQSSENSKIILQTTKTEIATEVAKDVTTNYTTTTSETGAIKVITKTQQIDKQSVATASIKNESIKKLNKRVPNMLAFEDDSQADVRADTDESPLTKKFDSSIHRISNIDIKSVSDSKYNFHYKLKDNILLLYGQFEASQYEILELNTANGLNLFLYYNEKYYDLNNKLGTISKLKSISDKNIVNELNLARMR